MDNDTLIVFGTIASAITALVSLFVAAYAVHTQRVHNKLSVRPLCVIGVGDYEDHIYVEIRNYGVGPLIAERVMVKNGGGPYEEIQIISLMPKLSVGNLWNDFTSSTRNKIVTPNGTNTLLRYRCDPDDMIAASDRDKIRAALAPLTIKVECRDIYNERHLPVVRELSWFRRETDLVSPRVDDVQRSDGIEGKGKTINS